MSTPDKFEIEILPDGSIKTSCDEISQASHTNAENFLKEIFRLAGGAVNVQHKHGHEHHSHEQGATVHRHDTHHI